MDEKIYNGESLPLTLTDKTQLNYSEEINFNLPKENDIIYKLPPKQSIDIDLDLKNLANTITDKETEILKINKEYLESKLWYWKIDKKFKFELPPTIFKEKQVIDYDNGLQYSNSGIQYLEPSIIGKRFSKKILSQIWMKGEFVIESNNPEIPYVWHISDCMVKGYDNIKESYANILSVCFMLLYTLKYRFCSKKNEEYCNFTFSSAFYHLYNSIFNLIDLFFGIPKYGYNREISRERIMHQRIVDFINNNRDLDFDFFNKETKNKLKIFDEKFELRWTQDILPSLMSKDNQEVLKNIRNIKLEEYIKFLDNYKDFTEFEKSHPCSKDYLLSQQILNEKTFYNNKEKDAQIKKYDEELKKHHIKYLSEFWRDDKMESFQKLIEQNTIDKIQTEVNREIDGKKDPKAVYNFNNFNKNELEILVNQYSKEHKFPKASYTISRKLWCYEKISYVNSNGQNVFGLKKESDCQIKSTFFFWRAVIFIVKYFYNLSSFVLFFWRLMINSMFGIKALFLPKLYRDYEINVITGEIYEIDETTTFPQSLNNLYIMVMESRDSFERKPDRGILGKGCMRIFHLFYNYIICLLILGILLIVFYPTMIFINVAMCIFFIITSPILIIIWIILDYLFTILLYNRFDDELTILPLLFIVFIEILYGFLFQLLAVISAFIFQPILSLIILIYAQIYFIIIFLINCIFFSVIACFGKVPQNDTCVAWQIHGPEIHVDRYYDISNKDIINLVRGYLEKIILENFKNKIETMLESPKKQIKEVNDIFGKLGFNFILTENIEKSIEFYRNKLDSQIDSQDIYPYCNLNIKFTKERLQIVKSMTSIYVTEYSKIYNISNELKKYTKLDDFVEEILKSTLGYSSLLPLDTVGKYTYVKSICNNEIDVIAKKIFENPYFQDKVIVEEINEDIINKSKETSSEPSAANFEQIFEGDLNLKFYPLTETEKEQIFNRSDNILKINFRN